MKQQGMFEKLVRIRHLPTRHEITQSIKLVDTCLLIEFKVNTNLQHLSLILSVQNVPVIW